MASVPRRAQSSAPPTPAPSSAAHTTPPPRETSQAPSFVSEDSDTVLLSTPPKSSPDSSIEESRRQETPQKDIIAKREPDAQQEPAEPRKCWICFGDETEDTPLSSRWRDPCPCALQAHESCLLDWVTDIEASNPRKRTNRRAPLQCPQCKSEIRLSRPLDPLVEAVKAIERVTRNLALPGVLATVGGTIVAGCFLHGVSSVYAIFGQADADRILAPFMSHRFIMHTLAIGEQSGLLSRKNLRSLEDMLKPLEHAHSPSWRLGIGLPLIPPILILSRFSITDSLLPIIPVIFFATQPHATNHPDAGIWPPSAAATLAVLPYVRGLYNEYYERVWGPKERSWLREVKPRNAEDPSTADPVAAGGGAQATAQQEDAEELGENEVDVQIEIGIQVLGDEAGEIPEVAPETAGHAPGTPNQENQPDLEQNAAAPEAAAARPEGPVQDVDEGLYIPTGRIADTVLGALLFPSVCALSGSILKQALPRSWTTPPLINGKAVPTGILQAKWGRSIVGGCLFVVLKDAIMLYVRWKQAQMHRKRRVMQYDKVEKRYLAV